MNPGGDARMAARSSDEPGVLRLMGCRVDLGRKRIFGDLGSPELGSLDPSSTDASTHTLTTKEREVLAYLSARPGVVVTRSELLVEVWGYRPGAETRTVQTTMGRLRRKVELNPHSPDHIITVQGEGYRFQPTPAWWMAPDDRPFVGRAAELRSLGLAFADCRDRLVTVVGAPGVGKTELVNRYVSMLRRPVVRVELANLVSSADVQGALIAQLGGPGTESIPQRVQALPEALFVLDNAEHVVAGVLKLITAVRAAGVSASWLVTTRSILGLPDEQVVELRSLGPQSGRALFSALFAAESDPKVVDEIVKEVGGLPLAIVVAVAQCSSLGSEQVLQRLRRSQSLISHHPAGRHASLTAALESSWQGLDADCQATLTRCSVFRSPFTLAAAEQLCHADPIDAVQSLVHASLLTSTRSVRGETRFSMLPFIRHFIQNREGNGEQVSGARVAQMRRLVAGARRALASQAVHLGWLLLEWDNLVAAASVAKAAPDHEAALWLAAAVAYCPNGGQPALDDLDTLMASVPRHVDGEARGVAQWARGEVLRRLDRVDQALATWRQTLSTCPVLCVQRRVAGSLVDLSITRMELEESERWLVEFVGLGGPPEEVLFFRARVHAARGEPGQAEVTY